MRNVQTWMIMGLALIGTVGGSGCMADGSSDDPVTDTVESNLTGTDVISGLNFILTTGSDDKRSDSHVFIAVHITNPQTHLPQTLSQEAGLGQTWSNNSVHSQLIPMPFGTHDSDIASFTVSWVQGGGGWNGDNWNLQQLQVVANDATLGIGSTQMSLSGNPFFRFTGSATSFTRNYVK